MTRTRLSVLALVVLFLTESCATNNLGSDAVLSADGTTGIVIASVSVLVRDGGSAPVQQLKNANLYYTDGDGRRGYIQLNSGMSAFFNLKMGENSWTAGGDFEELKGKGQGRLIVVNLPPGEYNFVGWSIQAGTARYSPGRAPPPIAFKVEANTITYVGAINFVVDSGVNVFGMAVLGDVELQAVDSRGRDIEMFKANYPKLANRQIQYGILQMSLPPTRPQFETQPVVVPAKPK